MYHFVEGRLGITIGGGGLRLTLHDINVEIIEDNLSSFYHLI